MKMFILVVKLFSTLRSKEISIPRARKWQECLHP